VFTLDGFNGVTHAQFASTDECGKTPIFTITIAYYLNDMMGNNLYFTSSNVRTDALGYYSAQTNCIHLYPGVKNILNIFLYPASIKIPEVDIKHKFNLPSFTDLQSSQTTSEIPQDEVRDMSLSLGIDGPKDTVSYLYAEKFAEEVNALSNGKMKIDIYTDAQLGTDRQMLQTIKQDGNIDFIVQHTATQSDFMPKLSVFDMPLVYTDINDLRNTIDNAEFYNKISNVYSDSGYKLLGIADELFRHLATNKEVHNVEDFIGIKIRTVQNRNYETFSKLLGAIIIPLPISEIYRGLQFGYIDSVGATYENIDALKLYELVKYVVNIYHLPQLLSLITSDKLYNNLSTAEKAIIDEAAIKATSYAREKADERFEESKKILIDNGMTIVDLPEGSIQEMRFKVKPVYENIRALVDDDDLINLYLGSTAITVKR
jgi:tripartite ATP-independent transporter DctP family solute receptor